jgi:hypothetical protein
MLVLIGVTNVAELAALDPSQLWQRVQSFCSTPQGKTLLRNAPGPTVSDVSDWIHAARQARALQAA